MCGYVVTTRSGNNIVRESVSGGGYRNVSGNVVFKASGTVVRTRSGGKVVEKDIGSGETIVYTLPQQPSVRDRARQQAQAEADRKYSPSLVEQLTQPQSVARQTLISVPGGGVHDIARQQSYRLDATPEQIARIEASRIIYTKEEQKRRLAEYMRNQRERATTKNIFKELEPKQSISPQFSKQIKYPQTIPQIVQAGQRLLKNPQYKTPLQAEGARVLKTASNLAMIPIAGSFKIATQQAPEFIADVFHIPISSKENPHTIWDKPLIKKSVLLRKVDERFIRMNPLGTHQDLDIRGAYETGALLTLVFGSVVLGIPELAMAIDLGVGGGWGIPKIYKGITQKENNIENITEGILLTAGGAFGLYTQFRRLGLRRITPKEEVFSEKALSGEERYVLVKNAAVALEKFQAAQKPTIPYAEFKFTIDTKGSTLLISKTFEYDTPDIFLKGTTATTSRYAKTTRVLAGETPEQTGLFITPYSETNVAYLRLGSGRTPSRISLFFNLDILKAKVLVLEYRKAGRVPAKILREGLPATERFMARQIGKSSAFISRALEVFSSKGKLKGAAKEELEAILPPGTLLKKQFLESKYETSKNLATPLKNPKYNPFFKFFEKIKGYSEATTLEYKVIPMPRYRVMEETLSDLMKAHKELSPTQLKELMKREGILIREEFLKKVEKSSYEPSSVTAYSSSARSISKSLTNSALSSSLASSIFVSSIISSSSLSKILSSSVSRSISKSLSRSASKSVSDSVSRSISKSLSRSPSRSTSKSLSKFFSKSKTPLATFSKKKKFKKVKAKKVRKYFKFAYTPDFFSVFVGEYAKGRERMRFTSARDYSGLELRKVLA